MPPRALRSVNEAGEARVCARVCVRVCVPPTRIGVTCRAEPLRHICLRAGEMALPEPNAFAVFGIPRDALV